MKILLIHPFLQVGGGELVIIRLANYFIKKGHMVGILCSYVDKNFLENINPKVAIFTPPPFISSVIQKSRYLLVLFGFPYLLYQAIVLSFAFDILFPHNFPSICFAGIARIISKKKIIWEYNEGAPLPQSLSFLEEMTGKMADSIIVLDNKNKKKVKNRFNKDAIVLRPGIDFLFWSKPTKKIPEFNKKTVLLSVGKLHPQKNQILLLDVFVKLSKKIPSLHLILVGKGPDEERIRNKIRHLHLEKHVTLTGIVDNQTLRRFYAASFLVCFPARDQTWGLTPFEALCQKTVSIVSSEAGAAEVLKPRKIALIASPTVNGFSEAVFKAYQSKDNVYNIGKRGYLFVKSNLTWETFCQQTLSLIQKLAIT